LARRSIYVEPEDDREVGERRDHAERDHDASSPDMYVWNNLPVSSSTGHPWSAPPS
jgi:hypothetical protein